MEITNIFFDNKWEEAKARPGNMIYFFVEIYSISTQDIFVEITNIFCGNNKYIFGQQVGGS